MKIANQQIQIIHTLLPIEIKSDPEAKAALISQFTGSIHKTSTKYLSFYQANELIKSLNGKPLYNVEIVPEGNRSFFHFDSQNKQHRTILSLAHQYGWEKRYEDKFVVDMARLAEWLMTKAPVKKALGKQSPKELSKTITALENMVTYKLKKNA